MSARMDKLKTELEAMLRVAEILEPFDDETASKILNDVDDALRQRDTTPDIVLEHHAGRREISEEDRAELVETYATKLVVDGFDFATAVHNVEQAMEELGADSLDVVERARKIGKPVRPPKSKDKKSVDHEAREISILAAINGGFRTIKTIAEHLQLAQSVVGDTLRLMHHRGWVTWKRQANGPREHFIDWSQVPASHEQTMVELSVASLKERSA